MVRLNCGVDFAVRNTSRCLDGVGLIWSWKEPLWVSASSLAFYLLAHRAPTGGLAQGPKEPSARYLP